VTTTIPQPHAAEPHQISPASSRVRVLPAAVNFVAKFLISWVENRSSPLGSLGKSVVFVRPCVGSLKRLGCRLFPPRFLGKNRGSLERSGWNLDPFLTEMLRVFLGLKNRRRLFITRLRNFSRWWKFRASAWPPCSDSWSPARTLWARGARAGAPAARARARGARVNASAVLQVRGPRQRRFLSAGGGAPRASRHDELRQRRVPGRRQQRQRGVQAAAAQQGRRWWFGGARTELGCHGAGVLDRQEAACRSQYAVRWGQDWGGSSWQGLQGEVSKYVFETCIPVPIFSHVCPSHSYFINWDDFGVSALAAVLVLLELNVCYALDPCKKWLLVCFKLISFSGCPNPPAVLHRL